MPERILVYGMTDNPGGIETYLMNQLRGLDREKVIFDFVTDFPTMTYADEATALGAKIYHIPAKSKGLFAHMKAMAAILRAHPEYKKVYFNILDAGAAFTEAVPWVMRRTVITHSHNGSTDKLRLHRLCRPFLNLFTKKRFACSALAATYMFGKRKATVIPNMISAADYAYCPSARQSTRDALGIDENFVVCHIGRLSHQKNPLGVLDIFEEVYKKDPTALLLSVGTGEMEQEVHAYAEKKNLDRAVRFLGKRSDIAAILQAADVFLLPSFYEGLPIVAIEAQAAGLPLILSDAVSKESAITENVRFLSLADPPSVWADAILDCKHFERMPTGEDIAKAGYDRAHPSAAESELRRYLAQP